jgi:putative DNA primase/helicase
MTSLSASPLHRYVLDTYHTALAALDAGISFIPVLADGSKSPAVRWKRFQQHMPTVQDARRWFSGPYGIALITGRVSGNLEMLDFDDREAYTQFTEHARRAGYMSLLERVWQGYSEYSPHGVHLYYRYVDAVSEGNQKLAQRPLPVAPHVQCVVETRGEGGYAIAAPSGGMVHPSGRAYHVAAGSLAGIVTLTAAERMLLLTIARSLDEMPVPNDRHNGYELHEQPSHRSGERLPGHIFNECATWSEILEPHGWTHVRRQDTCDFWRRPGKDRGISATTNYNGSDLLYVFSSSTIFEPRVGISKFAAYTWLEHGGDFSAAARTLAALGYRD